MGIIDGLTGTVMGVGHLLAAAAKGVAPQGGAAMAAAQLLHPRLQAALRLLPGHDVRAAFVLAQLGRLGNRVHGPCLHGRPAGAGDPDNIVRLFGDRTTPPTTEPDAIDWRIAVGDDAMGLAQDSATLRRIHMRQATRALSDWAGMPIRADTAGPWAVNQADGPARPGGQDEDGDEGADHGLDAASGAGHTAGANGPAAAGSRSAGADHIAAAAALLEQLRWAQLQWTHQPPADLHAVTRLVDDISQALQGQLDRLAASPAGPDSASLAWLVDDWTYQAGMIEKLVGRLAPGLQAEAQALRATVQGQASRLHGHLQALPGAPAAAGSAAAAPTWHRGQSLRPASTAIFRTVVSTGDERQFVDRQVDIAGLRRSVLDRSPADTALLDRLHDDAGLRRSPTMQQVLALVREQGFRVVVNQDGVTAPPFYATKVVVVDRAQLDRLGIYHFAERMLHAVLGPRAVPAADVTDQLDPATFVARNTFETLLGEAKARVYVLDHVRQEILAAGGRDILPPELARDYFPDAMERELLAADRPPADADAADERGPQARLAPPLGDLETQWAGMHAFWQSYQDRLPPGRPQELSMVLDHMLTRGRSVAGNAYTLPLASFSFVEPENFKRLFDADLWSVMSTPAMLGALADSPMLTTLLNEAGRYGWKIGLAAPGEEAGPSALQKMLRLPPPPVSVLAEAEAGMPTRAHWEWLAALASPLEAAIYQEEHPLPWPGDFGRDAEAFRSAYLAWGNQEALNRVLAPLILAEEQSRMDGPSALLAEETYAEHMATYREHGASGVALSGLHFILSVQAEALWERHLQQSQRQALEGTGLPAREATGSHDPAPMGLERGFELQRMTGEEADRPATDAQDDSAWMAKERVDNQLFFLRRHLERQSDGPASEQALQALQAEVHEILDVMREDLDGIGLVLRTPDRAGRPDSAEHLQRLQDEQRAIRTAFGSLRELLGQWPATPSGQRAPGAALQRRLRQVDADLHALGSQLSKRLLDPDVIVDWRGGAIDRAGDLIFKAPATQRRRGGHESDIKVNVHALRRQLRSAGDDDRLVKSLLDSPLARMSPRFEMLLEDAQAAGCTFVVDRGQIAVNPYVNARMVVLDPTHFGTPDAAFAHLVEQLAGVAQPHGPVPALRPALHESAQDFVRANVAAVLERMTTARFTLYMVRSDILNANGPDIVPDSYLKHFEEEIMAGLLAAGNAEELDDPLLSQVLGIADPDEAADAGYAQLTKLYGQLPIGRTTLPLQAELHAVFAKVLTDDPQSVVRQVADARQGFFYQPDNLRMLCGGDSRMLELLSTPKMMQSIAQSPVATDLFQRAADLGWTITVEPGLDKHECRAEQKQICLSQSSLADTLSRLALPDMRARDWAALVDVCGLLQRAADEEAERHPAPAEFLRSELPIDQSRGRYITSQAGHVSWNLYREFRTKVRVAVELQGQTNGYLERVFGRYFDAHRTLEETADVSPLADQWEHDFGRAVRARAQLNATQSWAAFITRAEAPGPLNFAQKDIDELLRRLGIDPDEGEGHGPDADGPPEPGSGPGNEPGGGLGGGGPRRPPASPGGLGRQLGK
jgi:hypothetical protein